MIVKDKETGRFVCGTGFYKDFNGIPDSRSNLYKVWHSMKRRCSVDSKYFKGYYGRGIKICKEWLQYENFAYWAIENGYKKGLSIDRIDNNGNYCPENCRWTDSKTQNNNTRSNHIVVFEGEKYTVSQLANKFNIKPNTLLYRLRRGWSVERAVGHGNN